MKITKKVDEDGNIGYYNEQGQWHREDGPARVYADGTKFWYINGKRHREDGPAREYANGDKEWYLNDKRHREDGPARVYADGTKAWCINGEEYSEQEFNDLILKKRLKRILEL